ncbi:hypothetical protein MRX96_048853 [Rhipicephalus microplus]
MCTYELQEPQEEPLDLSRSATSTSATISASPPEPAPSPEPAFNSASPSTDAMAPSPDALSPLPDAMTRSLESARSFAKLEKYLFRKSQDSEIESSGKSNTDAKSSSSSDVVSMSASDFLSSGSGSMSIDASRAPSPVEGRISSFSERRQVSVHNAVERSDSTVPEEFFARQLRERVAELEAAECLVDPTASVASQPNVAEDVASSSGAALGLTDSQKLAVQMSLTSEGLPATADDDGDEDASAADVLSELFSTVCLECGTAFENAGMVIEHRILVHDLLPG